MIIAAHCNTYQNQSHNYLLATVWALAEQHPAHHFIILAEKEFAPEQKLKNIEFVLMQPAIKNKLSLQYWYRFKMPALLTNKKVDIFISEAGMLCKKLTIPQYLFLNPENKRSKEVKKINNLAYLYPTLFAGQVSRATAVFITEPYLTEVIKNKKIPAYPVYHGISENYQPFGWEEKENWLNENTEGKEYFLFHVSETTKAQVLPMLKAFSIFKKWTESSLQLIFISHISFSENDIPKFNLYKYRAEVSFVNFTDDVKAAPLYAAAFLHTYLPTSMADENFGLGALQTKTALLTTESDLQKQRYSTAAAYCKLTEKAIAEKLLYYYKNDFEKENLINQAAAVIKNYSLKNSANLIANYLDL